MPHKDAPPHPAQTHVKVAETIETTENPNIKLLRRAILQAPSFASRNMIPKAIDLVNAADSKNELVRVA